MAALRQPARAVRLHVRPSGQEALVHGRRLRSDARVESRREPRVARAAIYPASGCAQLGEGLEPLLPQRARAASQGFRSERFRLDRQSGLGTERVEFSAQRRRRDDPGRVQFHACGARQLSPGRAARRLVAGAAQQRRHPVRRHGPRQFRRHRGLAGGGARPLSFSRPDVAAARRGVLQVHSKRRYATMQEDGRRRAVIEAVAPEIDGGRFPIKRTIGEEVKVEADAFTDGHDVIACVLLYRKSDETMWREAAMQPMGNDRWRGGFHVERTGCYHYCFCAWVDHFASWRRELVRRTDDEDIKSALLAGKLLIEQAASRAQGADALRLRSWAQQLTSNSEVPQRVETALDEELALLLARYPDRTHATYYDKELKIEVERERARFGAWYEMFPRSTSILSSLS